MLRRSLVNFAAPVRVKAELGAIKYYSYMAWDACVHVYHGFRLFGVNSRIAWQLNRRVKQGVALTRRERVLLETATLDLLRLIPFSLFIIIPAGELLLPVALKMFPSMIPSTFETQTQGRNRAFNTAKSKNRARQRLLEYATTQAIATRAPVEKTHRHLDLFASAQRADPISHEQLKEVSELFQDAGPLGFEKLPNDVIVSLATVSDVYKRYMMFVPKRFIVSPLRRQMVQKWEKLQKDDVMLEKEGFSDLTRQELETACQMRGMRWVDNTEALEEQLQAWIDLSADPVVPYHTLFFFKPTANSLEDSIKTCPVDARRKLLGLHSLPAEVQESMDRLCDKVHTQATDKLDKKESTSSMARKVDKMASDAEKSGKDLDDDAVKKAIVDYLTPANIDALYAEVGKAQGKITVSSMIEYLAADIHHSTHVVSNVFDALEMGAGSTEISKQALASVVARCKEELGIAEEEAKKQKDTTTTSTSTEKKSTSDTATQKSATEKSEAKSAK